MNNEKIIHMYDVNENIAKTYNRYLNINPKIHCCHIIPDPYVNTLLQEFSKPIQYSYKYFKELDHWSINNPIISLSDSANKSLIKRIKSIDKKKLVCKDNIDDKIAIEYIKNRPLSHLIIIWPNNNQHNVKNYINQYGIITIEKEISLSKLGMKNLICELYIEVILQYTTATERLNFIEQKCKDLYVNRNTNTINILLFESDNFAYDEFNDPIMSYSYNILKTNDPSINIDKHDSIYIMKDFYLTVEIGQMLFSIESIKFLNERIIENWLDENFVKTFMKLNAVKKWQTENVSLILQHTFILLDEATMGTYGIRTINKINCLAWHIDADIVYKEAFNTDTRIPFLKIEMPNTINWSPEIKEKYDASKDFNTVTLNEDWYYYWNGMKIMKLNYAVQIKKHRYQLTDFIDFTSIQNIHKLSTHIIIDCDEIKPGKHNNIKNLLIRFLKYDKIKLYSFIKFAKYY